MPERSRRVLLTPAVLHGLAGLQVRPLAQHRPAQLSEGPEGPVSVPCVAIEMRCDEKPNDYFTFCWNSGQCLICSPINKVPAEAKGVRRRRPLRPSLVSKLTTIHFPLTSGLHPWIGFYFEYLFVSTQGVEIPWSPGASTPFR